MDCEMLFYASHAFVVLFHAAARVPSSPRTAFPCLWLSPATLKAAQGRPLPPLYRLSPASLIIVERTQTVSSYIVCLVCNSGWDFNILGLKYISESGTRNFSMPS